jgi:glutamine cyclotransferase
MPRSPQDRPRHVGLALAGALIIGLAFAGCGADTPDADATTPPESPVPAAPSGRAPVYVADVVQAWPHDTGAYTQGLQWHQERLFEGTGQEGRSNIREVELRTGRVLRQRDLPKQYFGEGIVILGDNLYQITWKSGVAFVYDWKTFEPKGQFTYDGEGWGLTTDGTSLIMSNGSSSIVYRDPRTFAVQKTIAVTDQGQPVSKLNELEWVKGEIWANVWESDQIARIDPATGRVTGWLNLTGLLPASDRHGKEDVLNGIAYDAAGDRIFVTGKLWSKLYEIKLRLRD